MIKRKVYNGYAFEENAKENAKINYEIYEELKNKYKIGDTNSFDWGLNAKEYNLDDYDLFYIRIAKHYHAEYMVIKNNTDLTTDELLLIFDRGNLCFGGRKLGAYRYRVSED